MNVDDIAGDVIPTDFSEHDRLDLIFMRQHALMEKYIPIEVKNGLCHTQSCPVDLHDKFGQARLKSFFWRTTEELTEACEANRIHPELKNHTLEELADALHFLVEANLLAGITPSDYNTLENMVKASCDGVELETGCFEIIYYLGVASNLLKNRPWKNNHMLTDTKEFHRNLKMCLPLLIDAFVSQGMSADQIFRIYFKKSEVNLFRQRSGY